MSKEKKQHASLFIFELDKRINVFLVFRRELPALPALFMNTARKGKISSLFGIGCEPQGTRLTERHQVMGEQLTATGFSPSYTALLLAVGGGRTTKIREKERVLPELKMIHISSCIPAETACRENRLASVAGLFNFEVCWIEWHLDNKVHARYRRKKEKENFLFFPPRQNSQENHIDRRMSGFTAVTFHFLISSSLSSRNPVVLSLPNTHTQ